MSARLGVTSRRPTRLEDDESSISSHAEAGSTPATAWPRLGPRTARTTGDPSALEQLLFFIPSNRRSSAKHAGGTTFWSRLLSTAVPCPRMPRDSPFATFLAGAGSMLLLLVLWRHLAPQRATYLPDSVRLSADTVYQEALTGTSAVANPNLHRRTLAFDVCNGMSNQRLALLYGLVLASELGRVAILPNLILSGVQWEAENTLGSAHNSVPMSVLYDVPHLLHALAAAGVSAVPPDAAPPPDAYTHVDLDGVEDPVETLATQHRATEHLAVGCPLFRLPAFYFAGANGRLMWTALEALRPATSIADRVAAAERRIADAAATAWQRSAGEDEDSGSIGGGVGAAVSGVLSTAVASLTAAAGAATAELAAAGRRFNFLHLRMEHDWVEHCSRWENIPDGKVRNNCFNNTASIDQMLLNMGFPTAEPLYVATFWEQVAEEEREVLLNRLQLAGYQVVTSLVDDAPQSALPKAKAATDSPASGQDREVAALVDYELAMRAQRFLGNSVSTFSALALFQRRHAGRWASYYNGGDVPMAEFLPMATLPWVFVYGSSTPERDYLVRAAVQSALRYRGGVTPYCLYLGDRTAPIARWLEAHEVVLLHHAPTWAAELLELAGQHPATPADEPEDDNGDAEAAAAAGVVRKAAPPPTAETVAESEQRVRANAALLADFMRLELPAIPALSEHVYVLYTDPAVFFHRKVTLASFGLPLPLVMGAPMPAARALPAAADAAAVDAHVAAAAAAAAVTAVAAGPRSILGNVDMGVVLMHLPAMRSSYPELLISVRGKLRRMHDKHVLLKGAADVAAAVAAGAAAPAAASVPAADVPSAKEMLLHFYFQEVHTAALSPHFAAKAFDAHDPAAAIVHFLGAGPADFACYVDGTDRSCGIGATAPATTNATLKAETEQKGAALCEAAFAPTGGLCTYARKWSSLLDEAMDSEGVAMRSACLARQAPHLQGLCPHERRGVAPSRGSL